MSQYNLRFVPTLSCNQFLLNGQNFSTQSAIIANVNTSALTTEVIINDATKNQVLFQEIYGNIQGNVFPQLQAEINALEANVSILQGEMNVVEGNIVSLQNQINVLSGNVIIDETAIAELQSNTQFLRAPFNGLAGNTSFFFRGLQVYNNATDIINETTGTGIFSYLDGGAPGSQIQLRVEDAKNVFVKGSTTINTPNNGLVSIGGTGNNPMTFSVGNSTNNVEVAMNGNINLRGDSTSRISIYNNSSTKTAEIVGADEVNVLSKIVTAESDDGGKLVLTSNVNLEGVGVTIDANSGSASLTSANGTGIGTANGKIIDIQCSSGNNNSTINIGTQQGLLDTGFTTINIGNASALTVRQSSTFLDGDTYLPKIPLNPGGWDNLTFIGLPTLSSGALHGQLKSTFNPYIRSISVFCPEATVNSFIQTSGTFTVNVGLGAVAITTGAGGMALTCVAGLMAISSLIGGIGLTTAGGAIALTTGAGIIQMTTGAAPIAMETNIGDVLIKAGYSAGSTPELSLGSVYIQARDYSYITPDKGVVVGEGLTPPSNTNLLNTMAYQFTGNLFSNLVGNLTGVFSNTFITPNSTSTLLNPVASNLIYTNLLLETGTAFALLRDMDINGTIATSLEAIVPSGNLGANVAITNTTTNFYFPDNTVLPLNSNVKLFVYINDTPNIANYTYSTWQSNVEIQSNISGLINAYVEPVPPSYQNYMTVLGNVGVLSDVDVGANITVASASFPGQETLITRNSVTTTGDMTCNTLNYTILNPPIVIPNIAAGVDSIIAGTNISISPLNGIGNVVINCTLPNIAGVSSIIAGNGIEISPVGGQGNVTVSLAGSVIPPGGYLPINGGTMTGSIYQFPSSNINDNTIKKYRPVTSYQPPFPSIQPPTFTGEMLTFFNGSNSPEQTGFTGWFPQNMITAQPSVMTSAIPIATAVKYYEQVGGSSGTQLTLTAQLNPLKVGDHLKGGNFVYQAWNGGLLGAPQLFIYSIAGGKTYPLFKATLSLDAGGGTSLLPELDYTYQGESPEGANVFVQISASIDLGQGDPSITARSSDGFGLNWEGFINLEINQSSQFIATTVSNTQAVVYEYFDRIKQVSKILTLELTSGSYATGEEAVSGIFINPQRFSATKLIYIYGRFDTASFQGSSAVVVNNIFAFNVDTNVIVPLVTFTTDPAYSTPPVGTNGRVNGVFVSQHIVTTEVRFSVYFWGNFTSPNQMGNPNPPTGINWVNNGFAIVENDNWTVAQRYVSVPQQYLDCEAGLCITDSGSSPDLTQFFLYVNSFNGNVKNTIMGLTFDGTSLNKFSTDFCFINGDVGTSAINKVKNIQNLDDGIFFMGDWTGNAFNGNSNNTVYSIAATSTVNGNFYANGVYTNQFLEICGSSNSAFWIQNGVIISTTTIQKTNPNIAPVNYLIGTNGYTVGTNGGGVLTYPSNQINDPTFLPTKQPILGEPGYSVKNIPSVNDPTNVQLTCSLDDNNYWFSQTFNSNNPIVPPDFPTANAINGAKFAVGNFEMDKIVFSGNTDYNSVSFIAGDVENGDTFWYWQAQVGAIDYFAGNTYFPNITALGTQPVATSDTLGQVLVNGNIASSGINMNGFIISNVAEPVLAQDVATKNYVDNTNTFANVLVSGNIASRGLSMNNFNIGNVNNIDVVSINNVAYPPVVQRIFATGGDIVEFIEDGLRYRCHRFTITGAWTLFVDNILPLATFDFCIIGGGGQGGAGFSSVGGGGGGAGCLVVAYSVPFTTLGNITGTVGAGGNNSNITLPIPNYFDGTTARIIGAPAGAAGGQADSIGANGTVSFANFMSNPSVVIGSSGGGSGGGFSFPNGGNPGGSGTQSFACTDFSKTAFGGGKAGGRTFGNGAGGGGGGVAGTGAPALSFISVGGLGGAGFALTFDGTFRAVCCGGGGAGQTGSQGGGRVGTTISGGFGGHNGTNQGGNGVQNTGSGGGGSFSNGGLLAGGTGGSGIAMIRYVIG